MFEAIDSYVGRCTALKPEELDYFHSLLKPKHVVRKQWLLHEGDVCDWEAYVVKGCLRKYCTDDSGDEITLQFAVEDWWISDQSAYMMQTPARSSIQAIEDTDLLLIYRDDKEALFQKIPAFERMFRLMMQRSLLALEDRFVATLAQHADERYLAFLEKYPAIAQRVPQHYIASYLGITPEALSRIRGRLAKGI